MTTLTTFRIDEKTRREFHVWCIQNGTTVAAELRQHIDERLDHRKIQNDQWSKRWAVTSRNNSNGTPHWEDTY